MSALKKEMEQVQNIQKQIDSVNASIASTSEMIYTATQNGVSLLLDMIFPLMVPNKKYEEADEQTKQNDHLEEKGFKGFMATYWQGEETYKRLELAEKETLLKILDKTMEKAVVESVILNYYELPGDLVLTLTKK